ncbi:MAG: STAS domain-containing protein [Planctomycetota bacterium]
MAKDDFKIEQEVLPDKGVVLLRLAGYLDAYTFEHLEETIADLFAKGHYKLLVDLQNVEYISSAGAGVFVGTLSEAHEHSGNIVLMNPTANVREVFELLGLTQFFQVVEDRATALAAL